MSSLKILLLLPFLSVLAVKNAETESNLPKVVQKTLNAKLDGPQTPYELKLWIQRILAKDYRDALHNWSAIQLLIDKEFRDTADLLFLLLLKEQDLPKTYVAFLIRKLGRKAFRESKSWHAMESQFADGLARYLHKNGVIFTNDQKQALRKIPWAGVATDLKAWTYLRGGVRVKQALPYLPKIHPFRDRLELSLSLYNLKKGRVKEVIQFLADQVKGGGLSPEQLPSYYLQLARLNFQRADLKAAEEWYLKVPVESEEIMTAREELLWVWLRSGDQSRLRGNLHELAIADTKNLFMPELFVVRAISNLKLCYLEEAKQDFANFAEYNGQWANEIDLALKSQDPKRPPNIDWYGQLLEKAVARSNEELAKIDALLDQSIKASLPAIGKQKHWHDAASSIRGHVAHLTNLRKTEYVRQWRNNALFLTEAIRKMRFVKIELLSMIDQGVKPLPESELSAEEAQGIQSRISKDAEGKMSFPFDGVIWPDELFASRSSAHNICL